VARPKQKRKSKPNAKKKSLLEINQTGLDILYYID